MEEEGSALIERAFVDQRVPASQLVGDYKPEHPVPAPGSSAMPADAQQSLGIPDTGEWKMSMLKEEEEERAVFLGTFRSPSDTKGVSGLQVEGVEGHNAGINPVLGGE